MDAPGEQIVLEIVDVVGQLDEQVGERVRQMVQELRQDRQGTLDLCTGVHLDAQLLHRLQRPRTRRDQAMIVEVETQHAELLALP